MLQFYIIRGLRHLASSRLWGIYDIANLESRDILGILLYFEHHRYLNVSLIVCVARDVAPSKSYHQSCKRSMVGKGDFKLHWNSSHYTVRIFTPPSFWFSCCTGNTRVDRDRGNDTLGMSGHVGGICRGRSQQQVEAVLESFGDNRDAAEHSSCRGERREISFVVFAGAGRVWMQIRFIRISADATWTA